MRALLDVNVLIALLDPRHEYHARARTWMGSQGTSGWATCPLTQNGLLRILTQPNYPRPFPFDVAGEILRVATSRADHAFWPDDISLLDTEIVDPSAIRGPKQITDVYLLALAVRNGGRLVTFDRAIPLAAVRGAAEVNLVSP
jgi:uncharacterized protein